MKLIVLLCFLTVVNASIGSIDLQVPLTPKMAYDCQTNGHSIIMREASFDGVPLDGNIVFAYKVPEGVKWEDIKFRTHMGSLFITIPIMYPHFYSIQHVPGNGILV